MPLPIKFKKIHFLALFFTIVGILFVVRLVLPEHTAVYTETSDVQLLAQGDITLENDTISSVAEELSDEIGDEETATPQTDSLGIVDFNSPEEVNRILAHSKKVDAIYQQPRAKIKLVDFRGRPVKNKIKGTSSYVRLFNDLNDVQIATASRVGINRIADREAAAQSKDSLVYVGDNPYYDVKKLTHSIPYLVPRAAVCLEEIARAFMDSCVTKGLPMHKVVLTSVLRTEKDVKRLRRVNANASQNSCHQHGTTFDISYNHFVMVQDPNAAPKPAIPANRLKQILAEVLRDQRDMGTCFVKYEYRRSACFHITAR
jgi:hypothetical protein